MEFVLTRTSSDLTPKTTYSRGGLSTEVVNLDKMSDLLKLMNEVGGCVVVHPSKDYGHKLPTIEIYDDYRE